MQSRPLAEPRGDARVGVDRGSRRPSGALWSGAAGDTRPVLALGLELANPTLHEAVADLVAAGLERRRRRVVFVNAHVMNCAWADPGYWRTVATADVRYADGSGMAIAARLAGRQLRDNVNGTDMLPVLASEAARREAAIYLLGGRPGAADGSAATLARLGLANAIAGTHHGYFEHGSDEEARIIDAINASGASIVLVGFGVPLQDQWIERNAPRFKAPVLVGVGGLFDFYSGRVSRAPVVLRRAGLEWTWRLAQEPRRMWRRYIVGNVTFMTRAIWAALAGRREMARASVKAAGR